MTGKEERGRKESDNENKGNIIKWAYNPGSTGSGFPWGPHRLPLQVQFEGMSINVEKSGPGIIYNREGPGELVEKSVLVDRGEIFFSPVEPLHRPVVVSTHLMVEFTRPVVIGPRTNKTLMVTFPVELACLLEKKRSGKVVLDIFSLTSAKYTLYGNMKNGLICRYWKSDLYTTVPAVNPLQMGVMEINIQNQGNRWSELIKPVFSAQAMKIYHSPSLVSLKALVKIINDVTAETGFIDQPLRKSMIKAHEQFVSGLIAMPAKTLMEEGY